MKKNILIIEDDEIIRENLAELLQLEGFNVITADCGTAAISLAQSQSPDLIICDIMMPGMDGFDVLNNLRKNKLTYQIPFFFSTSHSQNQEVQKARAFGVQNYLIKPFDRHELMNCVEKCFLEYNDQIM